MSCGRRRYGAPAMNKRSRAHTDSYLLPSPVAKRRHSTTPSSRKKSTPPLFHNLTIFFILLKTSADEVLQLTALVKRHGGNTADTIEVATVIVTDITAPNRLRRYLTLQTSLLWVQKPVVRKEWIDASIEKQSVQAYESWNVKAKDELMKDLPSPSTSPNETLLAKLSNSNGALLEKRSHDGRLKVDHLPITRIREEDYVASKYSVQRLSPLYCINEALVRELAIIKTQREMEGEKVSQLSYSRAIASIKSLPNRITSSKEVEHVAYIGPKLSNLIEEFCQRGYIDESRRIESSERYSVMLMLMKTIHGIGPSRSRELYDEPFQVRSIEDLENLNLKGVAKVGLKHWNDLQEKIPRRDVEWIADKVFQELNKIETGCVYTICGGYRRGKSSSNDVDIIITHPDEKKNRTRHLLRRLVERLKSVALVTDVIHYTSIESDDPFTEEVVVPGHRHTHSMDRLDKAFTVIRQPPGLFGKVRGIHRRVDLIVSRPQYYGIAIVGWTGSTQFERDLRIWCKEEKGIKFDSGGMVEIGSEREVFAKTEQDVFRVLGLPFIPPELRNADVAG